MATKTWTDNTSFSETDGNFDGMKWVTELELNLRDAWQSKVWLGEADETEEWVGDETEEIQRGIWQTDFDGASATTGWGNLSWTDIGTGTVKARIKSASSQANLDSATWYPTGGSGFYESQPQDVECPDGRWCRLEMVLVKASTPILQDINLNYGEGC